MSANRKVKRWPFPPKFIFTEEGVRCGHFVPRRLVPWSEITGVDVYDSSGFGVRLASGRTRRMELPMPGPRLVLEQVRSCAPPQTVISLRPPLALRQIPRWIAAVLAVVLVGVLGASYLILREPLLFVGIPAGLLAVGYFALRWRRALRTGSTRNPFAPPFVIGMLGMLPSFCVATSIAGERGVWFWAFAGCMAAFFLSVLPFLNAARRWLAKLWRERAIAEGLLPDGQPANPNQS